MEATDGEYSVSLREPLRVIRRRLRIIVLVIIALVGVAIVFSFFQTPMYEGSITMLVGQDQRSDAPPNLGSEVQGLQQLTQTITTVIGTRPVAEGVIQELNLSTTPEDFLENLRVEQIPNTQVIQVNYRDPDPQRARQIADTVGEVFSRQVSEVSPGVNTITATLWERSTVPEDPVSPNPVRNGLLALVLGVILGVGLAFLSEYFDDSRRSPEEVEQTSSTPAADSSRAQGERQQEGRSLE